MSGPLTGIKVVEFGVAMAAPFCGQLLADYGAEVVKVERVGAGDDSRAWPPHFHGGLGHYFAAANRNKRSLAVDLKSPDGNRILRQLVTGADVLLENYRVGVLDRAGLGYQAMAASNPRLVYCSISGFGRTGPRREERANDLFMQAFSGGMSITGEKGGGPVKMGISVADIGAGLFAAFGIMSALEARHRTGRGQYVSTSLLGCQLAMLSYHLTSFYASGVVPGPQGSGTEFGVPYQAFPAADGWIIVAVFNEKMWAGLCRGIERSEWLDDPRFATLRDRMAHRDVLVELLSTALSTRPAAEWESVLKAEGVPCTRINRIDEIVTDAQVLAEQMITAVDVPGVGSVSTASPPVRFSETPGAVQLPPPRVGEHSRPVLHDLGLADEEIDALAAARVVGVDPA